MVKHELSERKTMHMSSPTAVPTAEHWKLRKEERGRVVAESTPIIGA